MKKTTGIIAAAALCGLGAIFYSAATAEQDNRLYSAPETAAKIGTFAEKLPGWAGANVILIGRDDLRLTEEKETELNLALNAALQNHSGGAERVDKVVAPYIDRYIDSFPALRAEKISGRIPAPVRRAVTEFLVYGRFSAGGARGFLPQGDDNGKNGFCIIVAPSFEAKTATEFISLLTGIAEEDLANIPGTTQDWLAVIMAHEAQHCQHDMDEDAAGPDINRRIANETMADQRAFEVYFREHAAKNSPGENVPAAWIALRAIMAISNRDTQHATHVNLSAFREQQRGTGYWGQVVTGEDLYSTYRKIDERIARDRNVDLRDARLIARQRPDVLYKTLETLSRENAFADNRRAQDFVSSFLTFSRIYAPGHFGVAGTAPAFTPAP